MGTSFQRSHDALLHSVPPTAQQVTADRRLHQRLLDTHGQVWVSLLWGHCSFLLGPGVYSFVCALPESVSPVLCEFWQLCGGVNGDLLLEGLCHTQACCTQSPCPHRSPLPTRTSTADTQTQFWLGLCGLGVRFVPFPGLSSSGNHVLGEHPVLCGPGILLTSPIRPLSFLGGQREHRLR